MRNSFSKEKKKGTILINIGLLLIVAAIFLAVYNVQDESRANESRIEILEQIVTESDKNPIVEFVPDYKKYPDMEMPIKEIDGKPYIGVLQIPYLGLELPIMSEWSYPNLKISPCRYEGSVYQNNMIIAAHNYNCHFGDLKSLLQGEKVSFTDMDGNAFEYEVIEMEIINPTDIERMKSGDWDLTLFTCTYGGRDRVTVRCSLME